MFIKRSRKRKYNIISRLITNPLLLTFLGVIIMGAIVYPLVMNINKQNKINSEVKELEMEIANLENKNLDLKELITYLDSKQFAEEQARLNLNLKKEGEEIVVINNKDDIKENNPPDQLGLIYNINKPVYNKKKTAANPSKWWGYFFN